MMLPILLNVTILFVLDAQAACPPFYADKMNLMVYTDVNGIVHPVKTAEDWQKRREHILSNIQLVMGPLPDVSNKVPLDMRIVEEVKLAKVKRRKIMFATERADRAPAYLLIPDNHKSRLPAVLCLHQTTRIGKAEPAGVGGNRNLHYALELAEKGYVTLAPDYPNFGEYEFDPYEHRYASATMKGIWNHMRAIDLLQSLPYVDPERIGSIGHSLGGHNTLFVAVFDTRIKAMVSSCGFNSFFKYYSGDLTGWSHRGYMPRIASAYGKDPAKMPFDFTEIIGALAPRPLFINAPLKDRNFEVSGVFDCVKAAGPVYGLLGAKGNLAPVHPDVGHEFPPAVRQAAYAFLDKALRPETSIR
jgi:dienelactone hydrolase